MKAAVGEREREREREREWERTVRDTKKERGLGFYFGGSINLLDIASIIKNNCEYEIHFSLFIFDSLYLFICIYLILIWFLYWYEDDRLILIVLINWVCKVYDFF